jgi:shikimate 5-dehydrogenase
VVVPAARVNPAAAKAALLVYVTPFSMTPESTSKSRPDPTAETVKAEATAIDVVMDAE